MPEESSIDENSGPTVTAKGPAVGRGGGEQPITTWQGREVGESRRVAVCDPPGGENIRVNYSPARFRATPLSALRRNYVSESLHPDQICLCIERKGTLSSRPGAEILQYAF